MELKNLTHFCIIVQLVQNYVTFLPDDEKLCKYMMSTVPFVWNLTHFCIIVQLVQIYVTFLPSGEEL